MRTRRVVCTGIGVVSPLGLGAQSAWSALLESRSAVVNLKEEHSFEGGQSKVAAYVPETELKDQLNQPKHSYMMKNAKQLSRATTFAMLATHEALENAKLLDDTGELQQKFRLRAGAAIGQGMVDFEDIYENGKLIAHNDTKKSGFRRMSPFFMTRALMNMSAGNVSIRYKLHGPNHCVSTACASGAHSIGDAFNFIRHNQADIMVCGSTEASINSIAMAGFERLKALSTKFNDNPSAASRPFDESRCGFVMGEGSGIVILEELNHAIARGVEMNDLLGEILGYGSSSDGHHLTAPAPNGLGARLSMKSALIDAEVDAACVTHVNAHATSTPLGDDIECNAIEDLFFPADQPNQASDVNRQDELTVTSCKSSIGHLLGGAGSVEGVFSILSCCNALLPPSLNIQNPLATPRNLIKIVQNNAQSWNNERRVLVKNSFGFGGTNASLVMSNVVSA